MESSFIGCLFRACSVSWFFFSAICLRFCRPWAIQREAWELKKLRYRRGYNSHALLEQKKKESGNGILGKTSSFCPSLYSCYHSSISSVFEVLNIMDGLAILVVAAFGRHVWIFMVLCIVSFITNVGILESSLGEEFRYTICWHRRLKYLDIGNRKFNKMFGLRKLRESIWRWAPFLHGHAWPPWTCNPKSHPLNPSSIGVNIYIYIYI